MHTFGNNLKICIKLKDCVKISHNKNIDKISLSLRPLIPMPILRIMKHQPPYTAIFAVLMTAIYVILMAGCDSISTEP